VKSSGTICVRNIMRGFGVRVKLGFFWWWINFFGVVAVIGKI
jgi:hypothetical protein